MGNESALDAVLSPDDSFDAIWDSVGTTLWGTIYDRIHRGTRIHDISDIISDQIEMGSDK